MANSSHCSLQRWGDQFLAPPGQTATLAPGKPTLSGPLRQLHTHAQNLHTLLQGWKDGPVVTTLFQKVHFIYQGLRHGAPRLLTSTDTSTLCQEFKNNSR